MARLTQSIQINAPPKVVFAFHADPRNIEKVAAPLAQGQLLPPYDVPLDQGSVVRLKVTLFGLLPQLFESEITVCDPPHEFTDEQRRGPFRVWRHRHLFREANGGTLLTDDVEYELPTGLPYRLIGEEAMTDMMQKLFTKRQEITKSLIEGV
jgi:ligand-binding SRPBCC domain-containing protein